jgi:hypothetical protein
MLAIHREERMGGVELKDAFRAFRKFPERR